MQLRGLKSSFSSILHYSSSYKVVVSPTKGFDCVPSLRHADSFSSYHKTGKVVVGMEWCDVVVGCRIRLSVCPGRQEPEEISNSLSQAQMLLESRSHLARQMSCTSNFLYIIQSSSLLIFPPPPHATSERGRQAGNLVPFIHSSLASLFPLALSTAV